MDASNSQLLRIEKLENFHKNLSDNYSKLLKENTKLSKDNEKLEKENENKVSGLNEFWKNQVKENQVKYNKLKQQHKDSLERIKKALENSAFINHLSVNQEKELWEIIDKEGEK